MGLDHVDLVYTGAAAGVELEEVATRAGELVAAGKARAWGLMLDPGPELVAAAARAAVVAPAAVQTAYSLVRRSPLEDARMDEALAISGARVVATAVMAGGALTGKYLRAGAAGRLAEQARTRRSRPRSARRVRSARWPRNWGRDRPRWPSRSR